MAILQPIVGQEYISTQSDHNGWRVLVKHVSEQSVQTEGISPHHGEHFNYREATIMKVYVVYKYADFAEDGSSHNLIGVYSTTEKALEAMNTIHKHHDLSTWGLFDYHLCETELDAMPDNDPWFTRADYTELDLALDLTLDSTDYHSNKVVLLK